MKTQPNKDILYPNLTKLYICALSAVAILCFVGQVLIQRALSGELKDSYIINVAGRQRMLSQRICKVILLLDKDPHKNKQAYLKELDTTFSLFNKFHYALYNRDKTVGLEGKNSEKTIQLFEKIDPYFRAMSKNIQGIINSSSLKDGKNIDESFLTNVLNNEPYFLNLMNDIVKQYEIESREKVDSLKRIEMILFLCILLVLLFEGFFIFRPAVKFLKGVNKKLETKILERTNEIQLKTEELKNKNEEMHKINLDLDNFIYTASHDLKGPISNIEGLTQALSTEISKKENKAADIIIMMKESIHKFKNILKDLSDTGKAKMEATGHTTPVKFKDVMDEVKFSIQELIRSSEATIKEDFSLVDQVSFSQKNLRSILYNLVSNAIKYKSPDRKPIVRIITESQDKYIVLKVIDNGLGISKENIPKIFSMYTRLGEKVEGTGVGLSIVKRVIDNSGGRVEVESEPGRGSTFSIYFRKNTE